MTLTKEEKEKIEEEERVRAEARGKYENRTSPITWLVLILFIIFVVLLFIGGQTSSTNAPDHSSVLNGRIETSSGGVYITNQEGGDWTNCMLGINNDGLDFHPAYQTRKDIVIPAGKKQLIPYELVTTNDGTWFSRDTHAINAVEIICFKDSSPRVGLVKKQ